MTSESEEEKRLSIMGNVRQKIEREGGGKKLEDSSCCFGGDPKAVVKELLGCKIICSLSDGRTVTGRLVCVDRL